MKTTFKIKKVLDKKDTQEAFTALKKASFNLANNCSNSPSILDEQKKLYYRIYRYLYPLYIQYDNAQKVATPIGNFETIYKYQEVKRIPKALLTAIETTKSPTKKDLESKIAELENKLNSSSKKRVWVIY